MAEAYEVIDELSTKAKAANEVLLRNANLTQLRNLALEVLACCKCAELTQSRTLPVCGFGSPTPEIVMVGEAPGRLGADLYGIPFSGDRSGVLLQKMLREVGLSQSGPTAVIPRLNRVYLTNLVRCNPRTVDGNNRAPTKEEMGNCANFLWREIQLLKPKVIATLGRHTTEVIVGQHVSSFQYTKPIHDKGFLVFPLHHPGYIIRGGGVQRLSEKKYKKEFWKLKNLIDGLRTLPRTTPYLEI